MAWITLSSSHISSRMAQDELDAIEATGGGTGGRITGIIAQVVSIVRGKVSACSQNTQLGVPGTIPDELLWAAATIARHDLRGTLPGFTSESDVKIRIREWEEAISQLNQAARCEIQIDSPDDGSGQGGAAFGGNVKLDFGSKVYAP